jgi:hypothetical protein
MASPYIESIEIIISIDWNYIAAAPTIAAIHGELPRVLFEELAAC